MCTYVLWVKNCGKRLRSIWRARWAGEMEMRDRKMTAGEARLGLCHMACFSAGGADSFELCYWRSCLLHLQTGRAFEVCNPKHSRRTEVL